MIGAALLTACSSAPKQPDYQSSKSLPPLEVPPDLVTPGKDQALNIPAPARPEPPVNGSAAAPVREGVTPAKLDVTPTAPAGVRVQREGAMRWLLIDAPPEQVWPQVTAFLQAQGFEIARDQPRIGILETEWFQDPRTQDALKSLLKKSFEDIERANLRNKYVIHIEPGAAPGTSEVYVSHRGLEQVAYQDATRWQPRPSDPMLSREIMAKFVVYLGGSEEQAAASSAEPAAARVSEMGAGQDAFVLNEDFASAWRRVGMALDQAGFDITDRNRDAGYYLVRTGEALGRRGWFSRFLSGGSEAQPVYRVVLTADGQGTRVELRNEDGKQVSSNTAEPLLRRLSEELQK